MRYDTIVIGAGAAGAVLATRLSEDAQRSVLRLEAGPDYATVEQLPEDLRHGHSSGLAVAGPHMWGYVAEESCHDALYTTPCYAGTRRPAERLRQP